MEELVKRIKASLLDPGQFTPRRHSDEESLEAWQGRATSIAVDQLMDGNVEEMERICSDACDEVEVNWSHIGMVFQWLINNNYVILKNGTKVTEGDSSTAG